MAIVGHLIGICFFGALAASGYTTLVQVLYWIGVFVMFFVAGGNYLNATRGLQKLSQKKPLPKELEKILPIIISTDYDVKCVHALFANVVHAVIALQLVHAPILAAFIMIAACCGIVTLQKFKELMKNVKNDPRYQ